MDRRTQPLKEKLLILLSELSNQKDALEKAEQFCWFTENGSSGGSCKYAQRALSIFYEKHYEKVRELSLNMVELIMELDNARK